MICRMDGRHVTSGGCQPCRVRYSAFIDSDHILVLLNDDDNNINVFENDIRQEVDIIYDQNGLTNTNTPYLVFIL